MLATNLVVNKMRQREKELDKARQEADAAARAKADFLANMSHEIRTPMNAIIGFSSLAMKTNMDPKQSDYIRKIQQSGKHLLGIIDESWISPRSRREDCLWSMRNLRWRRSWRTSPILFPGSPQ